MEQKTSFSTIISVIMPCYNNGQYIAQAIESVLAQTYDNCELVIVNDGSTDNSEEVIMRYAESDGRIRYFWQENRGASAARNYGVQEASGKYICFLDADDWLASECLRQAMDIFKKEPNCRLYYLKSEIVDEETGEKTIWIGGSNNYRNVLIYGMDVKYVIRREDFLNIGGFDEEMKKLGFEDWEFNVRFLYRNNNVITSKDVLYYYRNHNSGTRLIDLSKQSLVAAQSYIYKKNMEKYVEHLGSPILLYQYEDRLLPRLCRKILSIKAYLFSLIKNKLPLP